MKQTVEPQEIHIEVDTKRGNVTYRPALLHAMRGERVTWICDNPFAIQFVGISPLQWEEGGQAGVVRDTAQSGTYAYACAVCVSQRVYLDAACPSIIIDP